MRTKQVMLAPRDIKAGPDDDLAEGEFIVYPSTFIRSPDSYGDVVAKGAFAEGIAKRKEEGVQLPGLFGHRLDDPTFWVAYATEEAEDDHGWRVRGMFDLDDPMGNKVYRLVKGKRLRELSFAFDVLDEGRVELEDGVKANELRKLETYEFSFVPKGANRDTSVVSIKGAERILERLDGIKAGRVLSAKNEGALRAAYDAIGAVLSALDTEDEAPKADPVDPSRKDDEAPALKSDDAAGRRSAAVANLDLQLALAELESN